MGDRQKSNDGQYRHVGGNRYSSFGCVLVRCDLFDSFMRVIMFLLSCAGVRHTTVPADVRAQVEKILEGRHYAVAFRYPGVANPNKWEQEREECHVLGDTLLTFTGYCSFPKDAVAKSFRIEGYRQTVLESGAVEVAFSAREFIPGAESPVATPWRFVIYSMECVEIHVNASFPGATDASVFKGTLSPYVEKFEGQCD